MAYSTELYCLVAMFYLSLNSSYRTKRYLESILNCVVTCPEQVNQSLELFYGVKSHLLGYLSLNNSCTAFGLIQFHRVSLG